MTCTADLYSGKAQPNTSRVIPVDAKNARDISLQQTTNNNNK